MCRLALIRESSYLNRISIIDLLFILYSSSSNIYIGIPTFSGMHYRFHEPTCISLLRISKWPLIASYLATPHLVQGQKDSLKFHTQFNYEIMKPFLPYNIIFKGYIIHSTSIYCICWGQRSKTC